MVQGGAGMGLNSTVGSAGKVNLGGWGGVANMSLGPWPRCGLKVLKLGALDIRRGHAATRQKCK